MGHGSFQLTFHGVRGSLPTPETDKAGYGGNTSCLALELGPRHHLVIDCGTGLRGLARELGEGAAPRRFDVLLTHYHWDHIQGLPFFPPLYDRNATFVFHGPARDGRSVGQILEQAIRPPFLPVPLSSTPAIKRYVDLAATEFAIGDFTVDHAELNHPQGALAYRLARAGRSVVFATDHEGGEAECDARLASLARGADVLIHDAQYRPEEYAGRRGWGHSSWAHAVEASRAAGAGRLVLFHHDPDRSDRQLDAVLAAVRQELPGADAAREGEVLEP